MAIKPGEQKGIRLQDFFKFPTRFQCTDMFEDQCFRQVLNADSEGLGCH